VSDRGRNDGSEITLEVLYDDEAVEDAGVAEDTLALYRFVGDEWESVPDSDVDTDSNTVSATFEASQDPAEDTLFGLFGQTDGDGTDDNGTDGDDAGDGDAGDDSDADDGNDTDGDDGDDSDAGDDDTTDGDKSDDKNADDSDSGTDTDGDLVDVGARDAVIDLGDVTIADLDLDGPGLPDEHIDERTYSVGDFDVSIDGIEFTLGDTHYRVGHVTIDVEPFDVILEDVTLGNGE